MFGDPVQNNMGWPTKPIKEVAPETNAAIPVEDEYWWLNLDMIESYSGVLIERVIEKADAIGNSTHAFDDSMVLYSKLRPYLNKAIVPDGYGYATTELVALKPNPSKLNKYFLFNLLRGECFVNFANKSSSGAQMPRMQMKVLREFQCILPPLELQEQFIAFSKQSDKSKFNGFKSQFIEMFGDPVDNPMGWDTVPLLELGKCKNGMNFRSKDSGYEIHCLGVADFKDNDVLNDSNELPMISLNEAPSEEYLLADGDIVFVRSNGNKALVGRTVMVFPGGTPTTYSGFCIRFRKNDSRIETGYLLRILKMDSVRQKMAGRGANIQNLNQQILSQLNILLPPIDLQEKYLEFVQQSDKSKEIQYLDISSIDNSSKTVTGLTTSVAREWKMAQKPVMHQLCKKQSCSKRR